MAKKVSMSLRFYHATEDPGVLTDMLQREPSRTGVGTGTGDHSNHWVIRSSDLVNSTSAFEHADALAAVVTEMSPVLGAVRARGWRVDVFCLVLPDSETFAELEYSRRSFRNLGIAFTYIPLPERPKRPPE